MIPARITVATLGAYDMPSMRAFYRGLGWPEKAESTDDFATFYTGGCILALFPFKHLAADAKLPPSDIGTRFRGVTLAINVETRELVDSTIDALRAADARITKEPEDAFWGGRSSYFADPEGNAWEVVWAPGTFDEHGNFAW